MCLGSTPWFVHVYEGVKQPPKQRDEGRRRKGLPSVPLMGAAVVEGPAEVNGETREDVT